MWYYYALTVLEMAETLRDKVTREFKQACAYVTENPAVAVPDAQKLQFYALFKQATIGDAPRSAPMMIYVTARAKHDAWDSLRGTPPLTAAAHYVRLLSQTVPSWKPN